MPTYKDFSLDYILKKKQGSKFFKDKRKIIFNPKVK